MNSLVDRIANGEATLLGIEDICKRLSISRTTFDRWVRNGGGKTTTATVGALLASHVTGMPVGALNQFADGMVNSSEGTISFPPPDIRIGNSPKWELETFKRWLRANVTVTERP